MYYKVETFDKEENSWLFYSNTRNLVNAEIYFDVLKVEGKRVRILHEGKVIKKTNKEA